MAWEARWTEDVIPLRAGRMSRGLDGTEEVQALGRLPLRIFTDQVGKCVVGSGGPVERVDA